MSFDFAHSTAEKTSQHKIERSKTRAMPLEMTSEHVSDLSVKNKAASTVMITRQLDMCQGKVDFKKSRL